MARSRVAWLGPIAVALLAGCAGGGSTPSASSVSSAGGFTLVPHEVRTVYVGSASRDIRLCSDSGNAGPLDATIGSHSPFTLLPGQCTRDSGDVIELRNASAGTISGIYRSSVGRPSHSR